ncbi:MAG: glycosyltransferase, partial [Acidimicrobiia bacterium]|nr:glycosyltransferase [Acidimicrobiia bacterium]
MTSIQRLSVVVPVYSGEDHLVDLVSELDVVRKQWEAEEAPIRLGEVIFVDDASIDGSASVLAKIETEHPWIRVITLSRNFGQHPATVAGILHA